MKHGPIALIDEKMPVVAIATGRRVFDKVKSNLQEVKPRDGQVIVVTDRTANEASSKRASTSRSNRNCSSWVSPCVTSKRRKCR